LNVTVERCTPNDAEDVAVLAKVLLEEISTITGEKLFDLNYENLNRIARTYIESGVYTVFKAADSGKTGAVGFITLHESLSLYEEGMSGAIPEFFVSRDYRSHGIGTRLINEAKSFAKVKGWKRLEMAVPPIPLDKQMRVFYKKQGFKITGSRMNLPLG